MPHLTEKQCQILISLVNAEKAKVESIDMNRILRDNLCADLVDICNALATKPEVPRQEILGEYVPPKIPQPSRIQAAREKKLEEQRQRNKHAFSIQNRDEEKIEAPDKIRANFFRDIYLFLLDHTQKKNTSRNLAIEISETTIEPIDHHQRVILIRNKLPLLVARGYIEREGNYYRCTPLGRGVKAVLEAQGVTYKICAKPPEPSAVDAVEVE